MTIKAVFFDLDDTLHDHMLPLAKSLQTAFPAMNQNISIQKVYNRFREVSDELWPNYCQGKLTLHELRIQRVIGALKLFHPEVSIQEAEKFQKTYEKAFNHLELFPEVPDLLRYLKKEGYQLGIITNGPVKHQYNKIEVLGLTSFISKEHIIISDAVGTAKPDPEIFHIAADKMKVDASEIAYIGDSWENDVVGSIEAGWQSIWFNHRGKKGLTAHKPLAEIQNLSELYPILSF